MKNISREQKRLERLHEIEDHNPQMDDLLLNLVILTSDVLQVDYAAVHFMYENHQEAKASSGLTLPDLTRNSSVCKYTTEAVSPMVFRDLKSDPRTSDFWYVNHLPHLRSYAGVPLITKDGNCPGTLCVMDRKVRDFTDQDIIRLLSIAEEIVDKLEISSSKRSFEQKAESRKWRIREIHHRLKNNLAIISGISDLEYMRSENDQVRDLIMTMQKRIHSIASVHRKLYESESLRDLSFLEYIKDLVASIEDSYCDTTKNIHCIVEGDDFRMDDQNAVTIGLLINEMVTNAFKHAFADRQEGTIRINLKQKNENCYKLTVEDNGDGLPPDFNLEEPESLGFKLVKTLTKQLEADLDLETGPGTRYIVEFCE